jgi:Putative zinc-finger
MNCDCTEKISSLIDGELPDKEAHELEHHLMNCAECQEVRADFLNLRNQISSFVPLSQSMPSRHALAKILSTKSKQSVRSGSGLPASARGRGLSWSFSSGVTALATILLVATIIGLMFYNRLNKNVVTEQITQTTSPSPSTSIDKSKELKAREQQGTSGGVDEPAKDGSGDKQSSPQRVPAKPVRRSAPTPVREPKPGDQFAMNPERVRPGDAETMTAMHFEKSELLLRAFRNVRLDEPGTAAAVGYERKRAQQLVYQNMLLRREADSAGDTQVAGLLESLEPILLDIANLPDNPNQDAVRVIRNRVERKNIIALLQINSTALARALD